MEHAYEGKQLTKPIIVNDLLNGQSVATMQQPYLLTEADFLRLKGSPPITAKLTTILFSAVVGYTVSLGPKIIHILNGGNSQLTSGEIITISVGVVLSVLLYVVGFLWPNDKKKIMKKLSRHFDSATPSSYIVGGSE